MWTRFDEEGVEDLPVIATEDGDDGVTRRIHVGYARKRDIAVALTRFADTPAQLPSDDKVLRGAVINMLARGRATLAPETPVLDGLRTLLTSGLESLAVVTGGGEYLGSLSILDAIGCFTKLESIQRGRGLQKASEEPGTRLVDLVGGGEESGAQPSDVMVGTCLGHVRDIMNKNVVTLRTEARVDEAMGLFQGRRTQCIIVLSEFDKLRGFVTPTTLQLVLPPFEAPRGGAPADKYAVHFQLNPADATTQQALRDKVANAIVRPTVAVTVEDTLRRAVELLAQPGVRVLPVYSGKNVKPVATVSRTDLLRAMLAIGDLAAKRGLLEDK